MGMKESGNVRSQIEQEAIHVVRNASFLSGMEGRLLGCLQGGGGILSKHHRARAKKGASPN